MFIVNELKKIEEKKNIDAVRQSFFDNLGNVIENYISDKSMFSLENFSAIFFDEYTLKTNCHKDIFSTMYLEINQPLNYKTNKLISNKKSNNKIIIPELYLTLEEIKKGLINEFIKYFDPNNIIWEDKDTICIKSTIYSDDSSVENYYFKLIPCLTYFNKNNIKGIMHYYNGQIDIEYPDLSITNFNNKNDLTDDLFRQTILIFKNILLKEKKTESLPSEIIETLLYNVPTEMYLNDNKETLLNIANFLRNFSIRDFTTIDEQDFAFISIYRSMSMFYVKNILKIIEKFLTKN